jgi:hypothetical protein
MRRHDENACSLQSCIFVPTRSSNTILASCQISLLDSLDSVCISRVAEAFFLNVKHFFIPDLTLTIPSSTAQAYSPRLDCGVTIMPVSNMTCILRMTGPWVRKRPGLTMTTEASPMEFYSKVHCTFTLKKRFILRVRLPRIVELRPPSPTQLFHRSQATQQPKPTHSRHRNNTIHNLTQSSSQ